MTENTQPCNQGFKDCPGGDHCPTRQTEPNEFVSLTQQNRAMRERDNRFETDLSFEEYRREESIVIGVAVILFFALVAVICIGLMPMLVR